MPYNTFFSRCECLIDEILMLHVQYQMKEIRYIICRFIPIVAFYKREKRDPIFMFIIIYKGSNKQYESW